MIIIGADYHPGFQQIAFVDMDSGEFQERRLQHREEAEKFYRDLAAQGMQVRVGMEASGQARWFERLLSELHFELWIGDAAENPNSTSAQAEDGSPGCAADSAVDAGRSLSEDLGTELGESGSGDGTHCARVAQQVSPPDDAARTKNRQGRDGPPASRSVVLDVA
jgi:hypothetical protein